MSATDSLLFSDVPPVPDYSVERRLATQGHQTITGIDEAGRGPLAGPVVAAAVILDPNNTPVGLNDSKQLSQSQRETIFEEILRTSHAAWVSMPSSVIDRLNIRAATLHAMTLTVARLPVRADAALIDGRDVPNGLISIGRALVKGDARSVSIAAASIVAKVVRDRMMIECDRLYPVYGFKDHKGYGSKAHRDAIFKYGPSPLHRRSFSPVKNML